MKWLKPSGKEIETNDFDETIKFCKSLGWEIVEDKPKRKRRTKAQIEADKANGNG